MSDRRIALTFDSFGWESLESHAEREGWSVEELLGIAASYFERELDGERIELSVPEWKPPERGELRELTVTIDDDRWGSLHREADRQAVSIERLLAHAALLYLADVDAGRATERILDEPPEPSV